MAGIGPYPRDRMARDDHRDYPRQQDVEMKDAPPPVPPRRRTPRKLEHRSGPGQNSGRYDIEDIGERVIHVASSYSNRKTAPSSYRSTESRRRSARHDIKRSQSVPREKRFEDDSDETETSSLQSPERVVQYLNEDHSRSSTGSQRASTLSYPRPEDGWQKWQERDLIWKQRDDKHLEDEKIWMAEKHNLVSTIQNLQAEQATMSSEKAQWEGEEAQLIHELEQVKAAQEQQEAKEQWLEAQLKDKTARWKQTARELNSLRAQGQGFYQVTDNYLEGLVMRLRYNIRSFAIQYFSGKLPKAPEFKRNQVWQQCMEMSLEQSKSHLDYINDSDKRILMVQAFLWRILVYKMFFKFKWAGTASGSMLQLFEVLVVRQPTSAPSMLDVESIKKANIWRATTAELLLDSKHRSQSASGQCLQRWKDDLFTDIDVNVSAMQPVYHEEYKQTFLEIIDEALVLDKEICRQVSGVEWILTERGSSRAHTYDAGSMELEGGGVPSKDTSSVALVVSPGVRKQGKSSGEGFNTVSWLLKMEVVCV